MEKLHWYRFWKTWRNGGKCETFSYFSDEDNHEDNVEYSVEAWAEGVGGGFSYGYKYGFESIDAPSLEWVKQQLEYANMSVDSAIQHQKILTNMYDFLEDKGK